MILKANLSLDAIEYYHITCKSHNYTPNCYVINNNKQMYTVLNYILPML